MEWSGSGGQCGAPMPHRMCARVCVCHCETRLFGWCDARGYVPKRPRPPHVISISAGRTTLRIRFHRAGAPNTGVTHHHADDVQNTMWQLERTRLRRCRWFVLRRLKRYTCVCTVSRTSECTRDPLPGPLSTHSTRRVGAQSEHVSVVEWYVCVCVCAVN